MKATILSKRKGKQTPDQAPANQAAPAAWTIPTIEEQTAREQAQDRAARAQACATELHAVLEKYGCRLSANLTIEDGRVLQSVRAVVVN